ncbi:MAG TPA: alpha/beta hydrolase [Polyangiales bacterium]|nr:alpha/beta hydrolase [Polyangiales bacterium]
MRSARWSWLLALGLSACVDARTVALSRLDAPLPPRSKEWKPDVEAALDLYRNEPIVGPRDQRFEPIFGGITTLVYFAPDLQQKLADQRTPLGAAETGTDLASACGSSAASSVTPGAEPAYRSVWLPLPIVAAAIDPAAACDPSGRASPAGQFCMFARIATHADKARPLVMVVHGMFDSSTQQYVRNIGHVLFALGLNVLLLDMRDHGQTLRAAPGVPTTLGMLEARDLLTVAALAKNVCAGAIDGVGALGVSAGGLDVISAYAEDGRAATAAIDRGVVAISPLLDVNLTIDRIEDPPACSITDALELTWAEHVAMGVAGAALFFGGAAISAAADERALDSSTLIATGAGALTGLGVSLAIDGLLDGDSAGSSSCVALATVSPMFGDLLRARWQVLSTLGPAAELGAEALATPASQITLGGYLRLRSSPYYAQRRVAVTRASPESLQRGLRARPLPADPQQTKLLILSAEDDPVTAIDAHDALQSALHDRADVLVTAVRQGGHGAMWSVQEIAMRAAIQRFFRAFDPERTPASTDAATAPR